MLDMESSRTNPVDLEASSSHSEYGEPRPLNLGCRIFISHSGKDKNFVRFLHDKLVHQVYRDDEIVFFDEESLPTAEPITMKNILAEARGCELGILVLTRDFFTHTPNPMLELETLTTSNVQLLPLFFKISVDEFKKMTSENVWEEQWKEWLKKDEGRLGVWKHALSFVDRYSGLEYCKLATNELDYICKIVAEVAHIVPLASPFSEGGVFGMDRLCKIVNNMYNQCAFKRASDGCTHVASTSAIVGRGENNGELLDLVGMYGFPGLGKSTLCRCLCDFYFAEFHGNVCWLDLGSVPSSSQDSSQTHSFNAFEARMLHLLKLTGYINYGAHSPITFQIQNLLRQWIKKNPIFLAIDNILPNLNSLEEANFYLSCKFAKGSKIFITAKNKKILELITRQHSNFTTMVEHIPSLKFKEARDIFMHEILKFPEISNVEDEVKECVRLCVIRKDDDMHHQHDKEWYHPFMLKSSVATIKYARGLNVDLKSRLREFMQSATAIDKSDAWKKVFDMLDITYANLTDETKKVFLDLSLFYKVIGSRLSGDHSYVWIQSVYSYVDTKKLRNIFWSLEDLSFIIMKESNYHDPTIRMHDLMVDFSDYKRMQGSSAAGFNSHYLVLDNGAQLRDPALSFLLANATTRNECLSISASPKSVRTVSISGCYSRDPGAELEQLDLRNLEGVEVLHLVDNPGVQEVLLSRTTIAHLRSFIVRVPHRDDCVAANQDSLRCTIDEGWPMPSTASQMITGGKLVWVELEGNVILSTVRKQTPWWIGTKWSRPLLHFLGSSRHTAAPVSGLGLLQPVLHNLQHLALSDFPAKSLDVTTCTNLKRLQLLRMPSLRGIHGLETLTNLEGLYIHHCGELLLLRIPANSRLSTHVSYCSSLERISLLTMSHPEADCSDCASHGTLFVHDCPTLENVDGLVRYAGRFSQWCGEKCVIKGSMQKAIQELLESVETGSSKFKATVGSLAFEGRYPEQAGLAGLRVLHVTDAQHVGVLLSTLVKAQATRLHRLRIRCKEDGNCGCDKNEPYFGPGLSSLRSFGYECPQVRNLATLSQLAGDRLRGLSLRGCSNMEVWPDFATMISLEWLDLSYTSLKEWPTGVQLLTLWELEIEGCWQLPAEEMIKAFTCKPLLRCTSAWSRGPLASLLADLRYHRRDPGSVADALDSRLPELVALLHEQWQYLRYTCPILYSSRPISNNKDLLPAAQLCYLIRIMYDLWFGFEAKVEAGSTSMIRYPCADSVPTVKEKMKRLLCTEIFMSLPFYVWRVGRTKLHALDEWEDYPWPEGYESYMAFALVGSASIGCFNASLNDDLKDRMINFVQSFAEAQPQSATKDYEKLSPQPVFETSGQLEKDAHERLAMRVGDAVCKMARAPSISAALGQDFTHITMDGLKASYNIVELPMETRESFAKRMKSTRFLYVDSSKERKPSVAAKSGKVTTMDNGLGARVLHKVMPKIMPNSVLKLKASFFLTCQISPDSS